MKLTKERDSETRVIKVKVKPTKESESENHKIKWKRNFCHQIVFSEFLFSKDFLLLSNPRKKVKVKSTKESESETHNKKWNSQNKGKVKLLSSTWLFRIYLFKRFLLLSYPQKKGKVKLLSSNCLFRISLFKRFLLLSNPQKKVKNVILATSYISKHRPIFDDGSKMSKMLFWLWAVINLDQNLSTPIYVV